jgi:tetratricopeptide (TPR) repeat protein
VKLRLVVGTDGAVRRVRVISGPPILHDAAEEAAKKWKYQPFSVEGRVVEATFEVDVPFVIPGFDSPAAEADRKASNAWNVQRDACERAINARATDAETTCLGLPALAETLAPRRLLERAQSYEFVGILHYGRGRHREALAALESALAARLKNVKPGDAADADIGMNYFVIGLTHRRLGNLPEARRQYDLAESTVRKAIEWATALPRDNRDSFREEILQRYSESLRVVLRDLISLLQESGDAAAASAAESRLAAIK